MLNPRERSLSRRDRKGLLVQSALEDGFDVFIGVGLKDESSGTSSLQTFGRVTFLQAEDSKTRPVSLFRMGAVLQDEGEQFLGLGANGPGPLNETGGSPLEVLLVRFGHVLGEGAVFARKVTPKMRGDSLVL